jgi:hypothetical protein
MPKVSSKAVQNLKPLQTLTGKGRNIGNSDDNNSNKVRGKYNAYIGNKK